MASADLLAWLFALVATLMTLLHGVAPVLGEDPCMGEGLFRRVKSCFSSQGLLLPSSPESGHEANQLLREIQTVDPEVQCRQKEAYKAATNCTLATLQPCLAVAQMEGAIPEISRLHQGMDVICTRRKELDANCLKATYPDITGCAERTVRHLAESGEHRNSMNDVTDIICLSTEVHFDCARQYLKSCGNDTLDIFLQQLDQYQVPSACLNRRPGRPYRKTHGLISGGRGLHSVSSSFAAGLAAVVSLVATTSFVRLQY